jgi:hypothetical protein
MAAISWKTNISGNWSQASNWSNDTVPGIGDDVTIDAVGSYAVTADGFPNGSNNFVKSLTINAPMDTLAIASLRSLEVEGMMSVTSGTIDGMGELFTGGPVNISGQPLTLGGGLVWDTRSAQNLTKAQRQSERSNQCWRCRWLERDDPQ